LFPLSLRLKLFLTIVLILTANFTHQAKAASVPPTPGDSILLVYLAGLASDVSSTTVIQTALTAAPFTAPPGVGSEPQITLLPMTAGIQEGVANALASQYPGDTLSSFCQVWDLRFDPNAPGGSTQPCEATQDDVITAADGALYKTYLQQGGHLVVLADNSGYCPRDLSVVNFIVTVTGQALGLINTTDNENTWDTFFNNAAPDLFGTNVNNLLGLGGIDTWYPGSLTNVAGANGYGNGTPMITGPLGVLGVMWNPPQAVGSGKLFLLTDTNVISDAGSVPEGIRAANSYALVQNLYTTMSTCFNFTITKSVTPPTLCVGANAVFSIVFTNTGSRSITNPTITDALPSCFSYVSSNYSSAAGGPNAITPTGAAYVPSVTLTNGQSVTVNITATAINTDCP
jgi:uncharacterized repeat protein (TIGR01451 family)